MLDWQKKLSFLQQIYDKSNLEPLYMYYIYTYDINPAVLEDEP